MDIKEFIDLFADALDIFDTDDLKQETELQSLSEWSSMAVVNIVVLADEEMGKEISPDAIKACATIGDLYNLLKA